MSEPERSEASDVSEARRARGSALLREVRSPGLILLAATLVAGAPRSAAAQPALDAAVLGGIDRDTTAVIRLIGGGMWVLGRFAPEAHVGVDGFLRIAADKGISARSFNLIDLGARYGIQSERFIGPYVTAGGGFGLFTGKPHERKVVGEPEVCESADIPEGQPQDACAYQIDKNLNARLGFGWGFSSGPKTTVGIRLDIHYWLLSLSDYDRNRSGDPVPGMVPRPQQAFSVLIGLEFMRWR